MMSRLQTLFNRLTGVFDHGALQADNGLGSQPQSFAALERPACWRRRARKLARVSASRPR